MEYSSEQAIQLARHFGASNAARPTFHWGNGVSGSLPFCQKVM
jgi:hypothetical protein